MENKYNIVKIRKSLSHKTTVHFKTSQLHIFLFLGLGWCCCNVLEIYEVNKFLLFRITGIGLNVCQVGSWPKIPNSFWQAVKFYLGIVDCGSASKNCSPLLHIHNIWRTIHKVRFFQTLSWCEIRKNVTLFKPLSYQSILPKFPVSSH